MVDGKRREVQRFDKWMGLALGMKWKGWMIPPLST